MNTLKHFLCASVGTLAVATGCNSSTPVDAAVTPADTAVATDSTTPADTASPLDAASPDVITAPDVTAPLDASADVPADVRTDTGPFDSGVTLTRTTCDPDAGGATLPDGGPAPYACLGCVTYVDPTTTTREVTVKISDFLSGDGISGLDVKACLRTDESCLSPVATGMTDADGFITVTLPLGAHGFTGFVQVTSGSDAGTQIYPNLFAFAQPVTSGVGPFRTYLIVFTPSEARLLAATVGATIDNTRGLITFSLNDCNGSNAVGAALELNGGDSRTHTYYARSVGGTETLSPTATDTDETGIGATVNVPPGDYTLTSYRAADRVFLGSLDVPVKAGFATAVVLTPTP